MKIFILLTVLILSGCGSVQKLHDELFVEPAVFGVPGEINANTVDDYARKILESSPRYSSDFDGGVFDCLEFAEAAKEYNESNGGHGWLYVSDTMSFRESHAVYITYDNGAMWVIDINSRPLPIIGHPVESEFYKAVGL